MNYFQFKKITPVVDDETGMLEPIARSGHKVATDGQNLYSVGGYNPDCIDFRNDDQSCYPLFRELWKFNLARRKWTRLPAESGMPMQLASHTAALDGHQLLMFGGTGIPFGDAASNDLFVCNLKTLDWAHVNCTGGPPLIGYGHSMIQAGKHMYIFGGTTGWQYNADVHRLDLLTLTWEKCGERGAVPDGRYRHEVAVWRSKMFVLGGGRSYCCFKLDNIPCLDLEQESWNLVPTQPDSTQGYPRPRRCHACVQRQHNLYLCGGYNGQDIFSDFWHLDLNTMQWSMLPGKIPEPVYFHSVCLTPSGCLLVYGGVVELDTKRTSSVYCAWLNVPSLRQLAWQNLLHEYPSLPNLPATQLTELGVPVDLWQDPH